MIPHSRPWITDGDKAAVLARLDDGMIAGGVARRQFEELVGRVAGHESAFATASGQAALVLLLKAHRIGCGDQVIIPSYVCRSVFNSVRQTGAEPVLCDISGRWHMTPDDVARAMTKSVRAIVLVHLFGIDASATGYSQFGVPVIDDLCQAFGLNLRHRGDGGAFCSFHATKCLTTGEGGMVLCNDSSLAQQLRSLQEMGDPPAPLSDLQATLGLSQLARYEKFLARRKEIAATYLNSLPAHLTAELAAADCNSIFFRFPVHAERDIDEFIRRFAAAGVAARRGVDALLHRDSGADDARFPGAARRFATTLSIPIYPALTDEELQRTVDATKSLLMD